MSATSFTSQSVVGRTGDGAEAAWPKRLLLVVVSLLFLASWFGSLELRGLFIPDEGRYAEIPREMLATGDWVTPRLNGLKYFEKPPLQYWLTALSFRWFGEDEWTARLPSAMLGFLALLMVGYTGYRLWDARTGVLAVAILGSSCAYFLAGQYLTLDMTLTACLTFALCSFLLAQDQTGARSRNAWMIGAWVAAALAVLSKGLIGAVLPAATFLAYVALRRETALWRRLGLVAGVALFLLIATPWFVAVQHRNPEFFNFFFIQEHFQRFAEAGHRRPGPWWYYVPIVIVGLMPWTPALLKEGIDGWRARPGRSSSFSPAWFCAVWTGVIIVFFSASHSKLPAYILPAFPPMALLLARRLRTRDCISLKWSVAVAMLSGPAMLASIPLLATLQKFALLGENAAGELPWLYAAAGVLLFAGTAAMVSVRRGRSPLAVAILAVGALGFWNLVFGFLHEIDASLSSERLIESLTQEEEHNPFHPEAPFYSIAQFDHSVPFYLGRTVTLVDTRGELGFGIDAEPYKQIPTIERFAERWLTHDGQAYAILRRDMLATLRQQGLPMTELVSDQRLVVVARRAERR